MQTIENVVDYLAKDIDCGQLPCLSGDEVSFELNLCTSMWYDDFNGPCFYSNMVQGYSYEKVQHSPYRPTKSNNKRCKATNRTTPYKMSETVTKEEIELFRLQLKAHRIQLGLTQAKAAKSISKVTNRKTSQTSLCRFENNQLHIRNMFSLFPHFKQWVVNTQSF